MTLTCPSCSSSTAKKNGHIHNGKQNHQCLNCGRQFVFDPQQKIINEEKRSLIRQALLERVSIDRICRIFNVSMPWLLQFINERKIPGRLKKKPSFIQISSQCIMKSFLGYNTVLSGKSQERRATLKDLIIHSDKDAQDS